MTNGKIERLRYFKGQLLMAQDFEDQQRYHVEKLQQLAKRFPPGIVRGLHVICSPRSSNDDFDAFKIEEGFAVDALGNLLIVPEEGIRVNVDGFEQNPNQPYLSLKFSKQEACARHSVCEDASKNNRISETVEAVWERAPNLSDEDESRVTVALICLATERDLELAQDSICFDKYKIVEEDEAGPRIRIDAGLVDEDQLAGNSVSTDKIQDGAVTVEKLDPDVLENFAPIAHDHTPGSGGALIPITGLTLEVRGLLVRDGNAHDHSPDSGGNLIPEDGLEQAVRDQLVAGGDNHNHSPGSGVAQISHQHLLGLTAVSNPHGTTAADIDSQGGANRIVAQINAGTGIVAKERIDSALTTSPSGNAGGDLLGSSYPNPVIAGGAVTAAKLSLSVQDEDPAVSLSPNVTAIFLWQGETFSESDFNKPMIGYVIPKTIGSLLSWKMVTRRAPDDKIELLFEITNHNLDPTADPVDFIMRLLRIV